MRNLKWSNGSEITEEQIYAWINRLRNSEARHIQLFKLSEKVSYSNISKILKIDFPFPVDSAVLHELSLADAGLFPDEYETAGWTVTAGPYYVEKWDFEQNKLILTANKFSPFYNENMPQRAELFRILKSGDRQHLFANIAVDVIALGAPVSPKTTAAVIANAPASFESHPMAISFFYFNKSNKMAQSKNNRELFSYIISSLRDKISQLAIDPTKPQAEQQLIPEGFQGRLQNYSASFNKVNKNFTNKNVKTWSLRLLPIFKDMDILTSAMISEFSKHGIQLILDFTNDTGPSDKYFASFTSFLGNQLDATGSWSFLAAPKTGLLHEWYETYKTAYDLVYKNTNLKSREELLYQLHKTILDEFLAVPLMIGRQKYLLSQRVDVDRWNTFDARLRIYEIRWK